MQRQKDNATFVDNLFSLYAQNSFGSISKRELDIFLFFWFRKMGKIGGESPWDVAQELKISKSKAQTLLYESELRYKDQEDIVQIQAILDKVPCSFDNDIVTLIVEKRYVRDCMRDFLTKKGFVSDLSFASDVVKVPIDAYWLLQNEFNCPALNNLAKEKFFEYMKSFGKEVLSAFASSIGGEAAGRAVRTFGEFVKFLKNYKR